jgi:hypothetical protein
MGYIYKIVCNLTNEIYYGKSNGKANQRLNSHKCKSNESSSKQIIERGNYSFSIIEDNIEDNLLTEREYFYIKNNECININTPYIDGDNRYTRMLQKLKNNYNENPELYKKKSIDRYYNNHTKIREQRNEKIMCECGKEYTRGNKARHFKTHK